MQVSFHDNKLNGSGNEDNHEILRFENEGLNSDDSENSNIIQNSDDSLNSDNTEDSDQSLSKNAIVGVGAT